MNTVFKYTLSVIILFTTLSFKLQNDAGKVFYDKDRALVWSDFIGKVDNSTDNVAFTSSEISVNYSYSGNIATISLNRFFDKNKSWVKMDKKTDYILKHEQGHFDLTEIYFRKLEKKLKEQKFYAKTFGTDFNKIASVNSNELNKEQETYDRETNHSIIEPKQKEWDARIVQHLKVLEAFTETKFEVHLW